jgi:hypothetical protein
MSNNTKIFSEAIAEAKAIRETAMANAKLALEEAFTPRIKEMMSSKLEALAEEDEMEEGYDKELEEGNMDSTENMEEISLEELLSELEGLEEGEDLEEGKEEMEEGKEEMEENINEAEAEDEVGEITVDELKDIIRDVLADVMGGGEEEMEDEMSDEMEGEEETEEEEISLDEILAEIASLDEDQLDEKGGSTMKEPSSSAAAGADQIVNMVKSAIKSTPSIASKIMKALEDAGAGAGAAMRAESEELEEAIKTIATLRSELNEVNLLNAKLLFVNKLFKAKNLNESQKVKVINAFDRAETVKEAKNIYETLNESLTTTKKSPLKENLSFASKAVGVADKNIIVESNDFVARMQKLAGIK